MLIQDIYKRKPFTISENVSVKKALDQMHDDLHNGYVVTNDKNKVVGILTIQDIAAAVIPKQFRGEIGLSMALYKKGFFNELCADLGKKKVKDIMRKEFLIVTLDDNIMTVITDFLNNDLYLVPVIEDEKLIGIVTRTEIKFALAEGMQITDISDNDN